MNQFLIQNLLNFQQLLRKKLQEEHQNLNDYIQNQNQINPEKLLCIRIQQLSKKKILFSLKLISQQELRSDYLTLAKAYFKFGNYIRTMQIINQVGKNQEIPEAIALKGRIKYQQKRYKQAIELFESAVNSQSPIQLNKLQKLEILGQLSISYCKIEHISSCLEVAKRRRLLVLENFGNQSVIYAYILIDQAKIYNLISDFGSAFQKHSQGLQIILKNSTKQNFENILNLIVQKAQYAKQLKQYEQQKIALEMAIKIYQQSDHKESKIIEQIYIKLTQCYISQQQYNTALKVLLEVKNMNNYPHNARISELFYIIYDKLGRKQQGIFYLENALKIYQEYNNKQQIQRINKTYI